MEYSCADSLTTKMTIDMLNSLVFIEKNLSRLMEKIEAGLKYPDFFIPFPKGKEPSLQEYELVILSEIRELNAAYNRIMAYIESITDGWAKQLFEFRFIDGKAFPEIGQILGMPHERIRHEIYSYLLLHPEGFLSCRELSEKWGVCIDTVNLYCRKGLLPGAVKRTERVWMIPADVKRPVFEKRKSSHANDS